MNNNYYGSEDLYRHSQSHTHEYLGGTEVGEMQREPHIHRVAGISSEVIPVSGGHVHKIISNTTFDDEHIHHLKLRTGLQVNIGDNKHVHFVKGVTTLDDGHTHNFEFTTLIQ